MNKSILTSILLVFSVPVFADNLIDKNNQNFTGFGVGATLGVSKYTDRDPTGIDFKNITDFNLVASYGFDYGNSDFVGQIEADTRIGSGTVATWHDGGDLGRNRIGSEWGVAYVQGYRVNPNLMPYVKFGYRQTHTQTHVDEAGGANYDYDRTWYGRTYGVGIKYALMHHVELGAEYHHTRFSDNNENRKSGFNVGAAYRF